MTAGEECINIAGLLPAYANGTLSTARMRVVADHLGHCPACRRQLHEWQLITAAANVAATGPSPSPDVLDRIRAGIDAPHAPPRRSRHDLWNRMSGGHRRRLRPFLGDPAGNGQATHPDRSIRVGRSAIAEIAVLGLLVVILGGVLISRGWWEHILGDDSTATPQGLAEEQLIAQTPATGGLMFSSVLTNEATHPGANLRLGRLTIEPDSSTGLRAEESSVVLMVEAGIIDGFVDGPAIVTHGPECELAGQTEELAAGEQFELLTSDHVLLPIGTSSELHNSGQGPAQVLDMRIQSPGSPPRFANGVQYRQLAQASARNLPSGQVDFSLVEGNLSAGAEHEINGPRLFYVESGALEFIEIDDEVEIMGNDDPGVEDSTGPNIADSHEQISRGGWFFLKAGEHASLTVADGQATYIELTFEPGDTIGRIP